MLVAEPATAAEKLCRGVPRASFYQPLSAHAAWPDGKWQAFAGNLARSGMRRVIFQWSVADGQRLYRPGSTIPRALEMMGRQQLSVELGLDLDPSFQAKASAPVPELERYLEERVSRLSAFLPELTALSHSISFFAGWYVTDEIEASQWQAPERRAALSAYLRQVVKLLRAASPGKPVSISGYSSGALPPRDLARFWKRLLRETGLRQFYFQSGVGVHRDAQAVWADVDSLARALPDRVGLVIEAFQQTSAAGAFAARPAFKAEYLDQIGLASKAGLLPPIVFDVGNYMAPELVEPDQVKSAAQLLAVQADLVERCRP